MPNCSMLDFLVTDSAAANCDSATANCDSATANCANPQAAKRTSAKHKHKALSDERSH